MPHGDMEPVIINPMQKHRKLKFFGIGFVIFIIVGFIFRAHLIYFFLIPTTILNESLEETFTEDVSFVYPDTQIIETKDIQKYKDVFLESENIPGNQRGSGKRNTFLNTDYPFVEGVNNEDFFIATSSQGGVYAVTGQITDSENDLVNSNVYFITPNKSFKKEIRVDGYISRDYFWIGETLVFFSKDKDNGHLLTYDYYHTYNYSNDLLKTYELEDDKRIPAESFFEHKKEPWFIMTECSKQGLLSLSLTEPTPPDCLQTSVYVGNTDGFIKILETKYKDYSFAYKNEKLYVKSGKKIYLNREYDMSADFGELYIINMSSF